MKEIPLSSWTQFKEFCITRKNLNNQYKSLPGGGYDLYGPDCGTFIWSVSIVPGVNDNDILDFETNHKENFNWAIGDRPYPFATGDFDADFDAISGMAAKGEVTSFDFLITASKIYLNGAYAFGKNIEYGDWVEMSVYDKDGIIPEPYRVAFPNYPVIKKWVKKWYVAPNVITNVQTSYAGNPVQGLYLRMTYHSVGAENDVPFFINYLLHKAI